MNPDVVGSFELSFLSTLAVVGVPAATNGFPRHAPGLRVTNDNTGADIHSGDCEDVSLVLLYLLL